MTTWKCSSCDNTITAEVPPDICPSCKERCAYVDVTCYIPGCGGEKSGNINTEVFHKSTDKEQEA